ncbi:MAG: UvrD-helicase domain-containing protein, partial [Fusobacteriaceae bacterium]
MLNSSQKEVVQHTEGPLMVIAGPGTGKTFTLVKKVIYLLTEKKISPESIFITTFTRKAVNELRLRIAEEIKNQNLKIDS